MNQVSNAFTDQSLARVIERFPRWKAPIEREYARSETFHSLCDDWLVCSDAFQRWRSVEGSVARSRRSEYRTLMAELEQEIASWLDYVAKTEVSPTDQEY